MINGNSFGERLKNARNEKGLKQSDVAKVLECAATSLTNYESGKIQPPFDVLARLCDVLQISALDLLDKRYTYDDVLNIAKTPANTRSYEQQVALNFCGSILDKAKDKELKRLEKERENRDYISKSTGLTHAAVAALTVDIDTLFRDDNDDSKVSLVALEAINTLLTCPQGLQALENIAVYLRAGDYRFADGSETVTVDIGKFTGAGSTTSKNIRFTPDMVKAVARDEFLRYLDEIRKDS